MKQLAIALTFIASSAISVASHADENADVRADCARAKAEGRTCIGHVKQKDINFDEGDNVDGDRPTASADSVIAQRFGTRSSLIRVRTHFLDKILKSANDI